LEKNVMAAVTASTGFVLESIEKSVIYLIHTSFFLMRARPAGTEVGTSPRPAKRASPPPWGGGHRSSDAKAKQFHVGRAALNTSLDHAPTSAPLRGASWWLGTTSNPRGSRGRFPPDVPAKLAFGSHLYVVGEELKPTAGGARGPWAPRTRGASPRSDDGPMGPSSGVGVEAQASDASGAPWMCEGRARANQE